MEKKKKLGLLEEMTDCSLRHKMYKMSLKLFVVPDSEETIQDHKDRIKRTQEPN